MSTTSTTPIGVEITCPACRGVRMVAQSTGDAIRKGRRSGVCQSCAMKGRKRRFEIRTCTRCEAKFEADAAQKRSRCDGCGRRKPPQPVRVCIICRRTYRPGSIRSMNGEGCSRACRARIKLNEAYFGGRMFEAEGWEDRTCQCCGKTCVGRRFHVHHVYCHPDHSRLMILCPGCHSVISLLARATKMSLAATHRMADLVEMQRRRGPLAPECFESETRLRDRLAGGARWLAAAIRSRGMDLADIREMLDQAVKAAEWYRKRGEGERLPIGVYHVSGTRVENAYVFMRLKDFEAYFGDSLPKVEEETA